MLLVDVFDEATCHMRISAHHASDTSTTCLYYETMDDLVLIEEAVSEDYASQMLNMLPADFIKNESAAVTARESSQCTRQTRGSSLQLHFFAPLPDLINFISEDVIPAAWKEAHWRGQESEAAIVQRYAPGQGIDWHVDLLRYDDGVAILSLLSTVRMHFRKVTDHTIVKSVVLRPRSLLLCSGAARYEWEHCIESIDHDMIDDIKVLREDRISITMRRVKDKTFQ